ncbi:MAG: porin family protein [Flavobacteriaceae bacterium]
MKGFTLFGLIQNSHFLANGKRSKPLPNIGANMRGILWCFFMGCGWLFSQGVDDTYLEDQFYLGASYNIWAQKPSGVAQSNFPYGLFGGIIKDMPLNKRRTMGLGVGLGYAMNSYYSNLRAVESNGEINYSIDTSDGFKRSKMETHLVEMPIEFRFRTSTPEDHRFWRLYVGPKIGYVFTARSKFITDTEKDIFTNTDIQKFQYGLALNVGYNTFTIHAYYALSDFFEDGTVMDGAPLEVRPLRVGLIFYIL